MVKFLIKGESSWVPSRVHCSNKKKSIGIISWPSIFILLKYFTDFPKKSMHKVVRRGREIYTIICKHTFLVFLWSKEEFSLGCLALWQQCKTISGTQFQIYLCLEPHLIYFKVYFSKMPKVKTLFTMHTVHCIYCSTTKVGGWAGNSFLWKQENIPPYLFIYSLLPLWKSSLNNWLGVKPHMWGNGKSILCNSVVLDWAAPACLRRRRRREILQVLISKSLSPMSSDNKPGFCFHSTFVWITIRVKEGKAQPLSLQGIIAIEFWPLHLILWESMIPHGNSLVLR